MTHRPFLLAGTAAATALVSVTAVALPQTQVTAFAPANGAVFINEIHYDNSGADTGEAIEIAGPAGLDLAGWSLVLYNGTGGTSSEADGRLGRKDRPIDIILRGGGVVDLRAERFSRQGRTYTLYARIVADGQTVFDTATVHVPHNRRR
ncbi:hypothetical protein BH18ACT3_BH18ACT3_00660 [soil metagenome]